jgi:hypothetical protein
MTLAILQSFSGIINGYIGEDVVKLRHYTLADEEGRKAASEMGVTTGPVYFVNGEKHEDKITGEEIFESITSKLDVDKSKIRAIRKAFLKG